MKKASTPATNVPVIAGYYRSGSIYRDYYVSDAAVQASKLTHILYAFANLEEDGQVVPGDAFADLDKHFTAEQSVNGEADNSNEPGNNLYGNFKQFYLLKQKFRYLKVSLSVGGWDWSKHFAAVVADSKKRKTFVDTSIKLVRDLGLDGLDIDWEFPLNDTEASNYVLLLKKIREALDAYQEQVGQSDQPPFLLTIAAPCAPATYQTLHLSEMEPYIDRFYLMAYDYSGSWDTMTGHQANVYDGSLYTDQAVKYYLAAGIPPHKVVQGSPIYGRGFSDTDGIGSPFYGVPADGTWEPGIFDYKDLPKPGATEYLDQAKIASWSYDPEKRELISYDTPEAITLKCRYSKERNLGGTMFWELSADADPHGPRNLVNTVYNELDNIDQTFNHLQFPLSQFDNVRRQMGAKKTNHQSIHRSGYQSIHHSGRQRRHRNLPKL